VSLAVVKCGGAVAESAPTEIRALAGTDQLVVVHGAGPQISAEMKRRGLPVRFVGGRRVTDAATLEVVSESLAAVNRELCAALGPETVGLVGVLRAKPVPELGLVGEPLPVAPPEVLTALAAGKLPVVAPLAPGLNVNADDAAAALAVALGAERLLFLTDVPGLLVEDEVVSEIGAAAAEELLPELDGGIVPKLLAAVAAVRGGVAAHIGQTAVLP
jgi:acetylglutamate kinase